jgi:tetratricopeptide (TPR) repeat protein
LWAKGHFSYSNYAQFVNAYQDQDGAWAAADQQIQQEPASPWPHLSQAHITQDPSTAPEAQAPWIGYLAKAFAADKTNVLVREQIVKAHRLYGPAVVPPALVEDLVAQYVAETQSPSASPREFLSLVDMYDLLGRNEEALAACEQMASQWPSRAVGHLCTANHLLLKTGNVREAAAAYRAAIQAEDLSKADVDQMVSSLLALAVIPESLSELLAAVEQTIESRYADDYQLQMSLGKLYLSLENQAPGGADDW